MENFNQLIELKNISALLIEAMADFLDSSDVETNEALANISDPVERQESDLHERMAIIPFPLSFIGTIQKTVGRSFILAGITK